MLLTITTTRPATDLGYLLHKNPAKVHTFELSFGKAHVFYPDAAAEKCTAALLLGNHGIKADQRFPFWNEIVSSHSAC